MAPGKGGELSRSVFSRSAQVRSSTSSLPASEAGRSAGVSSWTPTWLRYLPRSAGLQGGEAALLEVRVQLNVPRGRVPTPFTNSRWTSRFRGLSSRRGSSWVAKAGGHYGDFQAEMISSTGVLGGHGRGGTPRVGASLPIPSYKHTRTSTRRPRKAKLWEVTTAAMDPVFRDIRVNSEPLPGGPRSRCWRLRIDTRKLSQRGGGWSEPIRLRQRRGVVT
jgi:hypothetical protein